MKEFWNSRYSNNEYAYGKQPNQFLKQELIKLSKGKILLPAEGEGRNAVFASKLGWEVSAFDISHKGKEKALKLAKDNTVNIDYTLSSVLDISFPENSFDCLGIFFMHLPSDIQTTAYSKLIKTLKKGGNLILEVFSKRQLERNTGGPKSFDMLFSVDELEEIFKEFSSAIFEEKEVVLDEGPFHQGRAVTIRGIGIK